MKIYLDNFIDYVADLPTAAKSLVLIFANTIEYIFPAFPGDTVVLLAGFLHAKGAMDLAWTILSIALGSLLGAYCGYQIGKLFLRNPHYKWAKKITASRAFTQFAPWFQAYGYWLLLGNRFVYGIRAGFFFAAGAYGLPLVPVLTLGLISAALFNGLLLLLGYWLGFDAERIISILYSINALFLLAVFALVAFLVWYYNHNKKP